MLKKKSIIILLVVAICSVMAATFLNAYADDESYISTQWGFGRVAAYVDTSLFECDEEKAIFEQKLFLIFMEERLAYPHSMPELPLVIDSRAQVLEILGIVVD